VLREAGFDAVHTGECGLATADDSRILAFARAEGRVVVTLDADFHAEIAIARASSPSTVRIRIEGLKAEAVAGLIQVVVARCGEDLAKGALISVTQTRLRIHRLPVGSPPPP
jgi:predicted nuclease of predicted toxin-antitoxin system